MKMAQKNLRKRQANNLAAIETLVAELKSFAEEFDTTDPERTQVALDTHISELMQKKLIKARARQKQPRLDSVLDAILGRHTSTDLIERAQKVQDLINTYLDEPSQEDMEEAKTIVKKIIQHIEEYVKNLKT